MSVIFQPERHLIHQQIERIGHHMTGLIIDVGAGKINRYKEYFKPTKYITVDIDPDKKPDIVASADNLPFNNNYADSIVCTGVMGDLPDLVKAVLEFKRILKPGGKILITEYFITQMHDEPVDFWRFTPYGLRELFVKNGFKEIFLEKRGGFFTMMIQCKIRYIIDRFNLYYKKWGRVFNPVFRIMFKFCSFLDKIDKSESNNKYSIGWTAIFEKNKN